MADFKEGSLPAPTPTNAVAQGSAYRLSSPEKGLKLDVPAAAFDGLEEDKQYGVAAVIDTKLITPVKGFYHSSGATPDAKLAVPAIELGTSGSRTVQYIIVIAGVQTASKPVTVIIGPA